MKLWAIKGGKTLGAIFAGGAAPALIELIEHHGHRLPDLHTMGSAAVAGAVLYWLKSPGDGVKMVIPPADGN